MIPIEVLKQVSVVYTHGKCPDGLASAMILKDAFRMLGMSPPIHFLVHNTPEHKVAGLGPDGSEETVLFCDIAPHPDSLDVILSEQGLGCPPTCIVLDHHIGAKYIVESFDPLGVFAHEDDEPGVSGAVLAFREVWRPIHNFVDKSDVFPGVVDPLAVDRRVRDVQDFAECVGVRDTWQTKDPRFLRGQWGSKVLMSRPASYWLEPRAVWPDGATSGSSEDRHVLPYLNKSEIETGRALFEMHELAVRETVGQIVRIEVGEEMNDLRETTHLLYVFQEQVAGHRLTSDVAEALRDKNLLVPAPPRGFQMGCVAGFSYVVDKPGDQPCLLYSLRGLNGFDVQRFATANGGGGHTAAAGFSIPLLAPCDPYRFILGSLETFLRVQRCG